MPTLLETASVIRSKNAGPLTYSFDLLFPSRAAFELAAASANLRPEALARRLGRDAADIQVKPYAAALAIKIAIPREVVAGSPGDRDVYGAQQHLPLLGIEL
jgi:hypothetical protein